TAARSSSGHPSCLFRFFQAEDGIRDLTVTGVQTCALPISGLLKRLAIPAVTAAASCTPTQPSTDSVFVSNEAGQVDVVDGATGKIGRASCRESGEIPAVAGAVERKPHRRTRRLSRAESEAR